MDPATIALLSEGFKAAAPLAGLLGGGSKGDVNVSQSATNTTSVSLTNLLSNQSPGDVTPGTGATAGGSAGSTASSQPDQPSGSVGFPIDLSPAAESNIAKNTGLSGSGFSLDTPTLLGIGAILALGGFFLTKKRRR